MIINDIINLKQTKNIFIYFLFFNLLFQNILKLYFYIMNFYKYFYLYSFNF